MTHSVWAVFSMKTYPIDCELCIHTCIKEEGILLTVSCVSCWGRPVECELCLLWKKIPYWLWVVFLVEEDPLSVSCVYYGGRLTHWLWVVCIVGEGPLTVSCVYCYEVPTDCELRVVLRNTVWLSCVYCFCSGCLKGESEVLEHEYTQIGSSGSLLYCRDPFTLYCRGRIIDYVLLRKTHWLCIVISIAALSCAFRVGGLSVSAYSCAFKGDILLQGMMYVSQNWICFYSKIRARGRLVSSPLCTPFNL